MNILKRLMVVAAIAAPVWALSSSSFAQDVTYRDFDKSDDSTDGDSNDRYQEAKRDFNQAVKRGTDSLKKGDYASANGYFTEALELDPDNAGVNYLMAMARIGLGKKGDAVGFLDKAVAADGSFIDARLLLAKLLVQGGDAAGARQQLEAMRAMQGACTGRCTDAALADSIAQLEKILG